MRSSFRDPRQRACALLLFPRNVCALLAEVSRPIWSGKNRMTEVADYRFHTHGMDVEPFVKGNAKVQTYKGAYISITDKCNTDICTYCYARDQQSGHKAPMSLSDFRRALDMLGEISDFPEVYLVGGEPSTVPNILEFLDAVAEKKWGATLYTNGAFGDRLRDAFAGHPGLQRVALHFEQAFFDSYDNFEKRWIENIRVLSRTKECSLLFVAVGADFDYARPLDLAEEFGLKLTWVFAAPSSGRTPFVGLPTMRAAGPRLEQFLLEAEARGVKTAPDLPTPLCVFRPEFLEAYRDRFALVRKCRPFVYFRRDLSMQSCTAMPCRSAPAPKNADALRATIETHRVADMELKRQTSFPDCAGCKHHIEGTCQGGCMTYKVYADTKSEL